jgi:hypothetical protein
MSYNQLPIFFTITIPILKQPSGPQEKREREKICKAYAYGDGILLFFFFPSMFEAANVTKCDLLVIELRNKQDGCGCGQRQDGQCRCETEGPACDGLSGSPS